MSHTEIRLRARLANNGRNVDNDNRGIPSGGDLHLAEMILRERDELLTAAVHLVAHLDARMKSASKAGAPIPVFDGFAALSAAIAKVTGDAS